MLKAIVFDLDDTLYPERTYALSGFAAVADWAEDTLGVPRDSGYQQLKAYFEAGVRGDTFNRWLATHGLPPERWVLEMVAVYREHTPQLTPFEDARPALERLRPDYRLGLITQGYAPGQQRKIEALGFTDFFEVIVIMGQDERELWKPGTTPYLRLLDQMDLSGPDAAYIGDHPERDFRGARELGMQTVWVLRPKGEHAKKRPPTPADAPDATVANLEEAAELLTEQVRS